MQLHPINRSQKQDVVLDFTWMYLDHHLKKNSSSWSAFNDSLTASSRITYMKSCTITSMGSLGPGCPFRIFPNPASKSIAFYGRYSQSYHIEGWSQGFYLTTIITSQTQYRLRFVKN